MYQQTNGLNNFVNRISKRITAARRAGLGRPEIRGWQQVLSRGRNRKHCSGPNAHTNTARFTIYTIYVLAIAILDKVSTVLCQIEFPLFIHPCIVARHTHTHTRTNKCSRVRSLSKPSQRNILQFRVVLDECGSNRKHPVQPQKQMQTKSSFRRPSLSDSKTGRHWVPCSACCCGVRWARIISCSHRSNVVLRYNSHRLRTNARARHKQSVRRRATNFEPRLWFESTIIGWQGTNFCKISKVTTPTTHSPAVLHYFLIKYSR